ncbi:adenine phosphoribosyltransferase [Spiribacter sp. 2438]|uniref:adenine phosphoribosyltransferase n=1 Tax=Spiribacter sp. 2438 TaxID=2666185 RepID=UPI0012AF2EA5|nr:adenine phosphoribosyltransferase [Spiribacter sp. 2438]QGM22352.1 adenine phosphoribosyltransferase [Spiribacter sp. 2438]
MTTAIADRDSALATVESLIRDIPDFPKPGILFKDITPLLGDAEGLRLSVDLMAEAIDGPTPEYIVGTESRGFIFGAALAYRIGAGFIPVRKPGKLPADVHSCEYQLEYGTDALEVHRDAFHQGARTLIVDDLLATGGTARATGDLLRRLGAEMLGYSFVIELTFLNAREHMTDAPVTSLIQY